MLFYWYTHVLFAGWLLYHYVGLSSEHVVKTPHAQTPGSYLVKLGHGIYHEGEQSQICCLGNLIARAS